MPAIALTRILVPTDFSETSAAAVKYAVALADAFGAQIHHHGVAADQRRDEIADALPARQEDGGKGLSSPAGLTLGSLLAC